MEVLEFKLSERVLELKRSSEGSIRDVVAQSISIVYEIISRQHVNQG